MQERGGSDIMMSKCHLVTILTTFFSLQDHRGLGAKKGSQVPHKNNTIKSIESGFHNKNDANAESSPDDFTVCTVGPSWSSVSFGFSG